MQAGLPALLGAAAKCFFLRSSFYKHQGASSAIPPLPQTDSSRDGWVTEMCRVHQESASHRVPTMSHHTQDGQVLALACTAQTNWRAMQCLGMVAHASLGGQLQWGIWARRSHSGREDILCCRFSPWFLSDRVLCSCSLQPQGHISPGNGLLWPLPHRTDPALTSHQQLKILAPFPGLYHSQVT